MYIAYYAQLILRHSDMVAVIVFRLTTTYLLTYLLTYFLSYLHTVHQIQF